MQEFYLHYDIVYDDDDFLTDSTIIEAKKLKDAKSILEKAIRELEPSIELVRFHKDCHEHKK